MAHPPCSLQRHTPLPTMQHRHPLISSERPHTHTPNGKKADSCKDNHPRHSISATAHTPIGHRQLGGSIKKRRYTHTHASNLQWVHHGGASLASLLGLREGQNKQINTHEHTHTLAGRCSSETQHPRISTPAIPHLTHLETPHHSLTRRTRLVPARFSLRTPVSSSWLPHLPCLALAPLRSSALSHTRTDRLMQQTVKDPS